MKTTYLKATLLLCAFLSFFTIQAQDNRYLEIQVSDTIKLKTEAIYYQISIGGGRPIDLYNNNYDAEEPAKKEEFTNMPKVKLMLDKLKFPYTDDMNENYNLGNNSTKSSVTVTLKNAEELKALLEAFKNEKGLSGKIKEIKYEMAQKYQEQIYRNLYQRALKQANFMTSVSGNTTGKLLSVSSTASTDPMSQLTGFMKTISKNLPFASLPGQGVDSSTEIITMTFRFEIK